MLRLVTPASEPRILCAIDSAVTPGVAAQEPPCREQTSFEEPMGAKCIECILRAARIVLARSRRRQQAERVAPDLDERHAEVPRAEVPHADAFPSTSVT